MQERTRIHYLFNSPVGTVDSLTGFFNGKMGVRSSFCTFFDFFGYFVRHFRAKNRIVLWGRCA